MGDDVTGPQQVPRLRLDELLDELQARINAVRGTRDRVHTLLEAVMGVGRELDLPAVLRRIVESAVVLVDAEYGALGVIGEDRQLAQFLPVGVTQEQIRAIGQLPAGHGILGELIRHPEPLRLTEISRHPESYGFPPNHPPMHSFLGVPIRVRDDVFGNLYLTEKRGGAKFDAEDEAVLSTLAVAAGVAVENARLYEETRLRERLLRASAEVTSSLLSGAPEADVLELIIDRSRQITASDLALIALPIEGSQELQVVVATGADADSHRGLVVPIEGSFTGAALASTSPLTSNDVQHDLRDESGTAPWGTLGPAVAIPLITAGKPRGVLVLARPAGSPLFTEAETTPLLGFAGQAALAMELAERRRDAEHLTLLEDRDRIARDLHDLAIQRLFATGMTLQSAERFVQHPEASERLLRAVSNLDETIKIIRTTIFGLRAHDEVRSQGLRARSVKAVSEAAGSLGFTPALRMEGLLDTDVPREVADDALAVIAEGLSNVARHAHATAAEVSLSAGSEFELRITDNGVGAPEGGRRSGLRNLAERAERLGGTLALERPPDRGTRLVWRVPLTVE